VLDLAVIALRWLQYVGAVLLMGVPLFLTYGLRSSDRPALNWTRPVLVGAAVAVTLGSLAGLIAQTAVMAGSLSEAVKPSSLSFMVTGTALGKAYVVRVIAGIMALGLILILRPTRPLWILAGVLGAIVTASFAWTGHGAATEGSGRWLHLGADVVHALAASVWLGALTCFVFLLTRRSAPDDPAIHRALAGFSGIGTAAVGLLMVSGLVNTAFLVGPPSPEAFGTGAYVSLLVVKLLLFGWMAVLAADNRYRHVPALESARAKNEDPGPVILSLRRSVVLETAAGAMLLAVVAVMGTLPPPSPL
jgi:putative copper resistance protein D